MQNICFPIQLLYFYSKARNLPVCAEMLVFIVSEKRLDANSFRSIQSLIQADFPKEQLL